MSDTVLTEVDPLKDPELHKVSKPSTKELKVGDVEDDEYLRQFLLFYYEFHKSEGFTVDWEKYDYAFAPRSLDNSPPIGETRTNAEIIRDTTLFVIEKYNKAHRTKKLVFDKHISANYKFASGIICWLTFWATDMASHTPVSQIYQVKVWRRGIRYDIPMFRLKPKEEEMDSIDVEPPTPMPYDDYEKPPVVFLRAGPEAGVPFIFDRSGAFYSYNSD
ncbi:uncharacterized protein LOC17875638 [Capsella rubella]|uniref:uncharacterized protein LOC17875638 n=1 Tax=Capsella rubella TaxID=81985 RepID=UPI000CD58EDF|nr:uncharacterized protein LOC17875638 [Capsella rubella]